MTDWDAFTALASSLVRNYSDSSLKRCLIFLDSRILDELTLKDRLLIRTGVTSTQFGRDLCFAKLFSQILKSKPKLFLTAPESARKAYFALITFLFSAKIADTLTLTEDEKPVEQAVTTESISPEKKQVVFTQKAQPFGDLLAKQNQSSSDEERAKLEVVLDERVQKLSLLRAKLQNVVHLAQNLPKELPTYIQPAKYPDKWQKFFESIEVILAEQNNASETFVDGEAFQRWISDKEGGVQRALAAISKIACLQALEGAICDFRNSSTSLPKALSLLHVEGFLSVVEEKILEGVEDQQIRLNIQQQKEKIAEIAEFQKQEAESIKAKQGHILQKLFSAQLLVYTDIPNEVQRLTSGHFEAAAIDNVVLTDDVVTEYKQQILGFYEKTLSGLESLVTAAKERGRKIDEMAQYAKVFFVITEPAKRFKDLQVDYLALESKVKKCILRNQDVVKGSYAENEAALQSCYESYLDIKANMPQEIDALIQKAQGSEQRSEDDKSAIKRRLFEIFWNISPYLDLMESFQDMRRMLTDEIKEAERKFYSGDLTSAELLEVCQEMPYEHDVVKLRNEITHRSARLKDLRDELLRLLREVQKTRRFLEVAEVRSEKVYSDMLLHQASVCAILADVENPFKAFSKAETKDDINLVFRNFWIRIEDVQPQVEKAQVEALPIIQKASSAIKGVFLKTLDSLEEAISLKSGSRPQLVLQREKELNFMPQEQLFNGIVSAMHSLEKSYSYATPFSLFMLVQEHKVRLKMFQEAAILDAQIDETMAFAKAMQYVKTFEEERVDIILEAFERQHIVEEGARSLDSLQNAWALYLERMHRASRLVEDEIFLDIGLLDRRALMDVDQNELNKTLRLAITRANKHIYEARYGILANLQGIVANESLRKKTLDTVKNGLEKWSKTVVDESKSTDWLLEHLRNYCHLLFDAKLIQGSTAKVLLPRCLDFMNQLRSFANYLEEALQAKRTKHIAEWGRQWIPECHAMRCEIECFEPEEESAQAFSPLLKKIYGIVDQIPERAELDLESYKKELEADLLEIDALKSDPKKEQPFIYIPGYLAFFDVREPS